MLRVGMTNPPFILEHLAEVAEVLRDPRVFSYLHVPVSGGVAGQVHAPPRRETASRGLCSTPACSQCRCAS